MLVLTRKNRESFLLGKDIHVKVLDVRSDQVKLGIEAPSEVRVVRSELFSEVSLRNHAAVTLRPSDLRELQRARQAEPQPDVFLSVETENLEAFIQEYQVLGFRVQLKDAETAWLERSHVWIRCQLKSNPQCEIQLKFGVPQDASADLKATVAPDKLSLASSDT